MQTSIENMSGCELLLLRALGGPEVGAAIDRELDRRALAGSPEKRATTPRHNRSRAGVRQDALLVA